MKKLYSLITLLMAFMAAGVNPAHAAKTVTIYCGYPDAIEVRDGGPEGTLMTLTGESTELVFNSEAVFIRLIDEGKNISSVVYNSYYNATITENTCTLNTADLQDNSTISVNLYEPTKVSLNIPDPTLITVKAGGSWGDEIATNQGLNTFTLGQYQGLYICVNDPENYKLTKVWRVSDEKEYNVTAFKECNISSYDIVSGDIFSYTIVPASEFETPTFLVTIIGDPAKVGISVDYKDVDMSEFVNNEPRKVEMYGAKASVSIGHSTYGQELYSVKVNGKEQQDSYGRYYLSDISADDNIVVAVDYPDEDYDVTITSDPIENLPFITSVEIDDEPVENWQSMKVHCGKKIKLNFDSNLYKFIGITSNGEEMNLGSVFSYVDLKITGDNHFVVKSEKYQTFSAKITVNDPEGIEARVNSTTLNLKEGENDVEFTEQACQLYINRKPGYLLKKVTVVNGESTTTHQDFFPSTSLEEGMHITVEVEPMTLDWRFIVYSDIDIRFQGTPENPNDLQSPYFYYFTFQDSFERKNIYPAEGYNEFPFCELMKEYIMNWSTKYDAAEIVTAHNIYLNNELLPYEYGCKATLADGDVVKMFLTKDPETYTAKFDVAEGCEVEVTKDLIVPVTDLTAALSELEGTLIKLKNTNSEKPIEVFTSEAGATAPQADDEETPGTKVEADADGIYNVTLDGSKTISVRLEKQSGVESVSTGNVDANTDVYTVTGTLVLRNATEAQIKTLPAGIYVVGHRKLVIR